MIEPRRGPINLFITLFFVGGVYDFKNSENKASAWIELLSSAEDINSAGKIIWKFQNLRLSPQTNEIHAQFVMNKPIEIEGIKEEETTINVLDKTDVHIRLKSGLVEIWSGKKDLCQECIRKIAQVLFGDSKYFSKVEINDIEFEKIRSKFIEITGTKLDKLRHPHFKEIGFKGFDITASNEYLTYKRDASGKIKMLSGWIKTETSVVSVSIFRWGRIRFSFTDSVDNKSVEEVITDIEKIITE